MLENSGPPESGGPKTPPVEERSRDWRSNLVFISDVSQKLAIPLLTVAATGLGVFLSYNANERAQENNRLALQNQREQSETSLRSTMFRELVGPLLSGKGEAEDDSRQAAQRLALQAELLTLNFHEHFELGPALRYVDSLDAQTDDARDRLRRAARRVISRQLAPMMAAPGTMGEAGNPPYVEIQLSEYLDRRPAGGMASRSAKPGTILPVCYQPPARDADLIVDPCKEPFDKEGVVEMICSIEPPTTSLQLVTGEIKKIQAGVQPLIIRSPDGRDTLKVSISKFDWDGGTVAVSAELQSKEPQSTQPPGEPQVSEAAVVPRSSDAKPAVNAEKLPRQSIEFTLSAYSLPYADNTLLPSGNRFGMYVKSADVIACEPGGMGEEIERQAIVWFVWFPKGFVPPRERPLEMDVITPDS